MNRAIAFFLPLVTSGALLAAEHGEGMHGESEGELNWWGLGKAYAEKPAIGFLGISFLVFAAGVIYFVRKPLASHLETRADTVKKAIEEATQAKLDAERRARDAEQKLANLDGEMQKLKAEFETQGKAEHARLEAAAHDASARIAKDAEDTITAEIERARQALQREAARLALKLAEERITAAVGNDDEVRLRGALVKDLGASA